MSVRDGGLLLVARGLRMLAYGAVSVVLALYLSGAGLSTVQIGVAFTVALASSAAVTTGLSLGADRWGRRATLIASAIVMAVTGASLGISPTFPVVLACAALGTLSPSGQEVGPFQSLEQAALSQVSADPGGVLPYAWYNLVGYGGVALGALAAGLVPTALRPWGWTGLEAQRIVVGGVGATGLLLAGLYALLTPAVEARSPRPAGPRTLGGGLHRSRALVLRLSALFGVDALAGGLVVQSFIALWFHQRFGVDVDRLGPLFFGTNLLSALSGLYAARLARRIGLLATMVFTHLPSNLLLALVPLMPTWPLAALVLLARHLLSQMDVPTRQAYTMALVAPDERAAAAGLTNAVRPAASSLAPVLTGLALRTAASGLPFFLAGGLKALYDVALWLLFRPVPLGALEEGPGGPRIRPESATEAR